MPSLGVNIDHVATLRQARGGNDPHFLKAALICEMAGCDSIVAHLREDRRHVNDKDVALLKKAISGRFNLEMSINKEIVCIAKKIRPDQATLVPEKRQELTTEGGMSLSRNKNKVRRVVSELKDKGIDVSIFIDPDIDEIYIAKDIGASTIEIHTGKYSLAKGKKAIEREHNKIKKSVKYGLSLGLVVNAGHGLDYNNVSKVVNIKGVNELNIGHSIISRAVFAGLYRAVKDMKTLVDG